MTKEEKQVLLKDLCARLPYGVIVKENDGVTENDNKILDIDMSDGCINYDYIIEDIKPYLRPMSSMTDEERKEYESFFSIGEYSCGGSLYGEEYEYIDDSYEDISQSVCLFDWLNAHHFDYRGLIEEGLAIEVTLENNPYKIEYDQRTAQGLSPKGR